jgi:hypothetical protein
MKLFKSLLVAPATIGLLAPFSAFAGEANLNDISKYSNLEHLDLANAFVNDEPKNNSLLAGGEGLVDSGSATLSPIGTKMGFDSGTSLVVDGVTYSFPVGGATMVVGDSTDVSATFTGACVYSAFTDATPDDCGTGSSLGVGGKGVTATLGYGFDSGFSLAGGISSKQDDILTKANDAYGINAAYSADSYGVALAYVMDDGGAGDETTIWGLNGYYSFDLASISVGYETSESDGTDKDGYFVGVSFPEVGPGSINVAAATTGLFADDKTETMIYEASYSYPVNDFMSITPGVFIEEVDGGDDLTGVAVKTSFSF